MKIPGFVDLQVNGYLGVNFSAADLTEDALLHACRQLLEHGAAAFLPTIITNSTATYERNLPMLAKALRRDEFRGRLLGLHVEGPFLSPEPGAVGAHNPEWVRPPDIAYWDQLLDWADGQVAVLTLAADQPGAAELARHASAQGVCVALGHQLSTEDQLETLADAGAAVLTHLGNGLPNMLPRLCNPIWAGIANDRLVATVIADGHHLPAAVLKTVIRAKGVDLVAVVSDASPMAGMPPGRYHTLGNDVILEESGLLHNPVKQCLVGSSANIFGCMNYLASLGFLDLPQLLQLGIDNPLRLIGKTRDDLRLAKTLTYDPTQTRFILE